MTYIPAAKFSTPSHDELALIAIMRADAAVLAERDTDAEEGEAARRLKISAARRGKKQSPQTVAARVAGWNAARARRAQSQPKATVSPVVSKPRRKSHG
jgi:hypothetical protein